MKTARQATREAHELWRACLAEGTLDDRRARLVVDEMIGSHRPGTAAVLKRFVRLLRLDRDARTAVVTSAAPLDAPLRAEIERAVLRLHGTAATEFVVDPALIAGVRVQIGSTVYDGSFRSGLASLGSRL